MFVQDTTKTVFQCMYDFDNSNDPEQRWKDLRHGVYHYCEYSGKNLELTSELLKLYWVYLKAL